MRTFFIWFQLIYCFSITGISAQTVVKMDMPKQADWRLKVVSLYEEEIPEGVPVVLGLMGYDIEGGAEPYSFEWLLNNKVISTNDIVVFTATKTDQLVLKVTDNNQCHASTSFNLKFAHIESVKSQFINVYPTIVDDVLYIDLPVNIEGNVVVKILDLKGNVVSVQTIQESECIPVSLVPGTYFVSVKTTGEQRVEKIIVR